MGLNPVTMYCDDRLATVLRARVSGELALATQYRQLLDLLGARSPVSGNPRAEQGFARLEALGALIPVSSRAAMLREPGMRLTNPRILHLLAKEEPAIASAAMAAAWLEENEWAALIPALPLQARGFLRHRKDLGQATKSLLAQLGVEDLGLPAPRETAAAIPDFSPSLTAAATIDTSAGPGEQIRAIVRRIEAFRARRAADPVHGTKGAGDAPRLPLDESDDPVGRAKADTADFAMDASACIIWASAPFASMLTGMRLGQAEDGPAIVDPQTLGRMKRHLPIHGGNLDLCGAAAIEGSWRLDAAPLFDRQGGRFTGYSGRLRRIVANTTNATDHEGHRIREMLHELRTPVNAIQGFAEIIQQQLFGPSPHEYRAIAAGIAADAARLLAGFEELDRLARLDTGDLETETGAADLSAILATTARQLEPALHSRNTGFDITSAACPALVRLSDEEAGRLVWRVMATLAATSAPGEALSLSVETYPGMAHVSFSLPAALAAKEDIFAASVQALPQTISAGMFGSGFTMRLARAESRSAGGDLQRHGEAIILALPLLEQGTRTHGANPADNAPASGRAN